jgi:hypothetical protein
MRSLGAETSPSKFDAATPVTCLDLVPSADGVAESNLGPHRRDFTILGRKHEQEASGTFSQNGVKPTHRRTTRSDHTAVGHSSDHDSKAGIEHPAVA